MTQQSVQEFSADTGNREERALLSILEQNSGSTETQIYRITQKVASLSSHLKTHKKDYSSQRGLRKLLGKRKRLLSYLANADLQRYQSILTLLGIRGLKKL